MARAAVRDERERDPGDRHHPGHHADVDQSWKRIMLTRGPRRSASRRIAGACQPISQDPPDQQPEQAEQRRTLPRKPRSSATTVKMKSVDCTGDVSALALATDGQAPARTRPPEPTALAPARADSRRPADRPRIQEAEEPRPLVLLQRLHHDRCRGHGRAGQQRHPADARAAHEEHAHQDRHEHEGRAQVRLLEDEEGGDRHQHARADQTSTACRSSRDGWPGSWPAPRS